MKTNTLRIVRGAAAALLFAVASTPSHAQGSDVAAACLAELHDAARVAVAEISDTADRGARLIQELDATGAPDAMILLVARKTQQALMMEGRASSAAIRLRGAECADLLVSLGASAAEVQRFRDSYLALAFGVERFARAQAQRIGGLATVMT